MLFASRMSAMRRPQLPTASDASWLGLKQIRRVGPSRKPVSVAGGLGSLIIGTDQARAASAIVVQRTVGQE